MRYGPPAQPTRTYSKNESYPRGDRYTFRPLLASPAKEPFPLPGATRIAIRALDEETGPIAVKVGDHVVRSRTMNPGQRSLVAVGQKGDVVVPYAGYEVQADIDGEWLTIARC